MLPYLLVSAALATPTRVIAPLDVLLSPSTEEEPPPLIVADALLAHLTPGETSTLTLTWRLTPIRPGWLDLPLLPDGPGLTSVTLDGRPIGLSTIEGWRHLVVQLDRPAVVEVEAVIPSPDSHLAVPIAPGVRTRLDVDAEGLDVTVTGGVPATAQRFDLAAPEVLEISWKPAAPPSPRPRVVLAESATAATVDSAGITGRSVIRYRILHGDIQHLDLALSAPVESLEIGGPAGSTTERTGDRVRINLARPTRGQVEITVEYRAAPPTDADPHAVALPRPVADHHEGYASLSATSMTIAVPGSGLSALPRAAMPDWGRGLSEGEPIGTWRVTGAAPELAARLLDYTPLEAPPTFVDEARIEAAATTHGRTLVRARYQVRNDRNQYLRLTPPPGMSVFGVRVAGAVVQPVADGGDVLIPLEKSVETLEGLVSFPVEVLLWGRTRAWQRRGQRAVVTPAVDAPIATARWELVLPPNRLARKVQSSGSQVDRWTRPREEMVIGRAIGRGDAIGSDEPPVEEEMEVEATMLPIGGLLRSAKRAPPAPPQSVEMDDAEIDARQEASQEAWNQAYSAYKANRFEDADELLGDALTLDPGNSSAQALQRNVDVLLGDEDTDEVLSRRVREMARAKMGSAEVEQSKLKKKAEEAVRAGDLAQAEDTYRQLSDVTRALAQVEQAEQTEQKSLLAETEEALKELSGKRSISASEVVKPKAPEPPAFQARTVESVVIESGVIDSVVVESRAFEMEAVEVGGESDYYDLEFDGLDEDMISFGRDAPYSPDGKDAIDDARQIIAGERASGRSTRQQHLDDKEVLLYDLEERVLELEEEIVRGDAGASARLSLLTDEILDLGRVTLDTMVAHQQVELNEDAPRPPMEEETPSLDSEAPSFSYEERVAFLSQGLAEFDDTVRMLNHLLARSDGADYECVQRRLTSVRALQAVAEQSAMRFSEESAPDRREHEWRKFAVAIAKCRQFSAEGRGCVSSNDSGLDYYSDVDVSSGYLHGPEELDLSLSGRNRELQRRDQAFAAPSGAAAGGSSSSRPSRTRSSDRTSNKPDARPPPARAPMPAAPPQPVMTLPVMTLPVTTLPVTTLPVTTLPVTTLPVTATAVAAPPAAPPPPPIDAPLETVTAANLTLRVPRAGQTLRFEQHLVAPGVPLSAEFRYRTAK